MQSPVYHGLYLRGCLGVDIWNSENISCANSVIEYSYGLRKISLHPPPKEKQKLPVKNWLTNHVSEKLLLISIEVMGITPKTFWDCPIFT